MKDGSKVGAAGSVRSGRLFALQPIGSGGAAVESLTSYISRLAAAHCLPNGLFVMQELAPHFARPTIMDGRGQCDLFGKTGASLNGLGGIADDAVRLIEILSKRKNLDRLTLLPLRNCVATRSSIRLYKYWCPVCLRSWRKLGQQIYDMLIWQVSAVRVCPFHPTQFLRRSCQKCGHNQMPLVRNSHLGFCCNCGEWLGACDGSEEGMLPIEQQVAEQVRRVFQAMNSNPFNPSLPLFRNNLQLIVRKLFGGSIAGFARTSGLHHSSVADLLYGKAKPGVNTVVQISVTASVSAADMLSAPVQLKTRGVGAQSSPSFQSRRLRRYQWGRISAKLAAVTRASQDSISLHSFCKSNGYDPAYVARQVPGAKLLIAAFRSFSAARHSGRLQREAALLGKAVEAALKKSMWPSERQIKRELKKPGIFRNPQLAKLRVQLLVAARTGDRSATDPQTMAGGSK